MVLFSAFSHHFFFSFYSFPFLSQKIDAQAIEEFYGLTSDISKNSESGYILFYQSREWRSRGGTEEEREKRSKGRVFVKMTSARFLFHIPLLFLISYSGSPAETACQKPSVIPFPSTTFPNLAALCGGKMHLQIWPSSQSPASGRHFINNNIEHKSKTTTKKITTYSTTILVKTWRNQKLQKEQWVLVV